MVERAFIIMQVGASGSTERKRADEIYQYVVAPAVEDAGLEPYRSDLDLNPGAITPKMLSQLLGARVIIADLTGRNPNVFYELGIAHSFARPVISIADSASALPFDAKDERVIELGEYPSTGLAYSKGEEAKLSLRNSLTIVLADKYVPPSPLREAAAYRSVDQLAPENPLAAEMAKIRDTLEKLQENIAVTNIAFTPDLSTTREDIDTLRLVVMRHMDVLDNEDFIILSKSRSAAQQAWAKNVILVKPVISERRLRLRGGGDNPPGSAFNSAV
jgi:hypothetical protein